MRDYEWSTKTIAMLFPYDIKMLRSALCQQY